MAESEILIADPATEKDPTLSEDDEDVDYSMEEEDQKVTEELSDSDLEIKIESKSYSALLWHSSHRERHDISSTFTSESIILIDGDGLLAHYNNDPLLDWTNGGQPLHLISRVVRFLDLLHAHQLKFHIIFFSNVTDAWMPSLRAARCSLVLFLRQSPYCKCVSTEFSSPMSVDFQDFRKRLSPIAIMSTCRLSASFGDTNIQLLENFLAYTIADSALWSIGSLLLESFEHTNNRLYFAYNVSIRDRAVLTEILDKTTHVLQQHQDVQPQEFLDPATLSIVQEISPHCLSRLTITPIAVESVAKKYPHLLPVARAFVLHTVLLQELSSSQRCLSLPRHFIDHGCFAKVREFLQVLFESISNVMHFVEHSSSTLEAPARFTIADLWDGRLFIHVLLALHRNRSRSWNSGVDDTVLRSQLQSCGILAEPLSYGSFLWYTDEVPEPPSSSSHPVPTMSLHSCIPELQVVTSFVPGSLLSCLVASLPSSSSLSIQQDPPFAASSSAAATSAEHLDNRNTDMDDNKEPPDSWETSEPPDSWESDEGPNTNASNEENASTLIDQKASNARPVSHESNIPDSNIPYQEPLYAHEMHYSSGQKIGDPSAFSVGRLTLGSATSAASTTSMTSMTAAKVQDVKFRTTYDWIREMLRVVKSDHVDRDKFYDIATQFLATKSDQRYLQREIQARLKRSDYFGLHKYLMNQAKHFDPQIRGNRNRQMQAAFTHRNAASLLGDNIKPFVVLPPSAKEPKASSVSYNQPSFKRRGDAISWGKTEFSLRLPDLADVSPETLLVLLEARIGVLHQWKSQFDSKETAKSHLKSLLEELHIPVPKDSGSTKPCSSGACIKALINHCCTKVLNFIAAAVVESTKQRFTADFSDANSAVISNYVSQLKHGLVHERVVRHQVYRAAKVQLLIDQTRQLLYLARVLGVLREPSLNKCLLSLWIDLRSSFQSLGFSEEDNLCFFRDALASIKESFTQDFYDDNEWQTPMRAMQCEPGPGMSLHQFQLTFLAPLLERPLGSKDPRIRDFTPDIWQRELLNIVDARQSALVCAPTSSGKTFICFYVMEQVIRDVDHSNGLVVYVCPSKALVNQVYSDILARFRKNFSDWPKSQLRELVGVFTRDYRIADNSCQILVTVPDCLEILMLSNHVYWERLRYIIFDEVHTMSTDNGDSWERLLLMSPCPFVALSATIGNPDALCQWLNASENLKRRTCTLTHYSERHNELTVSVFDREDNSVVAFNLFSSLSSGVIQKSGGIPPGLHVLIEQYPYVVHVLCDVLEASSSVHSALAPFLKTAKDLSLDQSSTDAVASRLPSWLTLPTVRQQIENLKSLVVDLSHKHPDVADVFFERISGKGFKSLERDQSYGGRVTVEAVYKCLKALQGSDRLPVIVFKLNIKDCEKYAESISKYLYCLQMVSELRKFSDSSDFEQALQPQRLSPTSLREKFKLTCATFESSGRSPNDVNLFLNDTTTCEIRSLLIAVIERRQQQQDAQAALAEAARSRAGFDEEHDTFELQCIPDHGAYDAVDTAFTFGTHPTMEEILEYFPRLSRDDVIRTPKLRCLLRGIAFHHKEMEKKYRLCVEHLFRLRKLSVVFATGTLSTGINMPCRSVVIMGDSPHLHSLSYQQMAGRAGRRGYDMRGHVVLLGVPHKKFLSLLHSSLPRICGNTIFTATSACRMLVLSNYFAGVVKEATNKKDALHALLAAQELFLNNSARVVRSPFESTLRTSFQQVLPVFYSQLFIDFALLQPGSKTNTAAVTALAHLVTHLHYKEPANILFTRLLYSGFFHSVCSKLSGQDLLDELLIVAIHLFHPVRVPEYMTDDDASAIVLRLPPAGFVDFVTNHNKLVLDRLTQFMAKFSEDHTKRGDSLALQQCPMFSSTDLVVPPGSLCSDLLAHTTPFTIRDSFVATSGHDDGFQDIQELIDTCRSDLYVDVAQVPIYAADCGRVNGFIFDFFKSRNVERLETDFHIRRQSHYEHFKEFSHVLLVIAEAVFRRTGLLSLAFDAAKQKSTLDEVEGFIASLACSESSCRHCQFSLELHTLINLARANQMPKPPMDERDLGTRVRGAFSLFPVALAFADLSREFDSIARPILKAW